jgi:hypothetical protein
MKQRKSTALLFAGQVAIPPLSSTMPSLYNGNRLQFAVEERQVAKQTVPDDVLVLVNCPTYLTTQVNLP